MMEIEGKITSHRPTIAEKLNNYYVSVPDNITNHSTINNIDGDLNKINSLNYLYSVFKQSFKNIKIKNTTTNEIGKITKKLKSKKSCGYDEITTKILKISSPFMVSLLTYTCNRMLSTRTFLDGLKFLEIKPICKKLTKHLSLITGQFHYFLHFQKSLKSLYIKNHIIF